MSAQRPLTGLPSAVVPSYGAGDDFTTTEGRAVMAPPAGATITVAQRNSPPLFGIGLFELVSDATIFALADPNDADGSTTDDATDQQLREDQPPHW